MRTLDLYPDRQRGVLIESLTSVATVSRIIGFQNDTLKLRVHGGTRKRTPAETLETTAYLEDAWSFNALSASLSLIDPATGSTDVPPESGRFKLKVGDQTTGWLTWPIPAADALSESEIATFKAAVLTALKGLSNVGTNGIAAADPAKAPVHTLYFKWTDPEDDRDIEVVTPEMIPPVEPEVGLLQVTPRVQYVKLTQLPIALQTVFTFPDPPIAAIAEEQPGSTGVNAVQILTFPTDGAFAIEYQGAKTSPLACASLTPAAVAAALNALVPGGTTKPGFAVTARTSRAYAIEFIGDLAATAQAEMVATMTQAASSLVAEAPLPLTSKRFERALNGAKSATFRFELVIDTEENTFQADFVMTNDATGPGTLGAAEEAGAISIIERVVIVDNTSLAPIATVAPGVAFTPGSAGASYDVTHDLDTRIPNVVGFKKISSSPEKWRLLTPNAEFKSEGTSLSHVLITPAETISSSSGDANYFGNYKFHIWSPNALVQLAQHLHSWDDVFETVSGGVGSGLTVAEKFAALDAAIGIFSGTLSVPASNITGSINASQIDIASFIAAMLSAITGNATLQAQWAAMLQQTIVSDSTFLGSLFTAAIANPTASQAITTIVLNALSSINNPALSFSQFPDVEFIQPPRTKLPGITYTTVVPSTKLEKQGTGSNSIEISYTGTQTVTTQGQIVRYGLLPRLLTASSLEGSPKSNVTLHPDSAEEGKVYNVSGDNVIIAAAGGRAAKRLASGTKVAFYKGLWYEVRQVSTHFWPVEMETDLFLAPMTGDIFAVGTGWNLQFAPEFQIDCLPGSRVVGRVSLALQTATYTGLAADTDLASLTWSDKCVLQLPLSDVPRRVNGSLKFRRTGDTSGSAEYRLGSQTGAFSISTGNLAARLKTLEFDLAGTSKARGAFIAKLTNATDSIVSL